MKHGKSDVPWDQVILACVEYKVALIDSDLWVSTLCGDFGHHDSWAVPVEWLRAQADTSLSSVAHAGTASIAPHRKR